MDSPLLKLPPELRLQIYEPLMAAGDTNILRTNKLIHKEATDVLKSMAILRMNFSSNRLPSEASFPLTGSLNLTGTLTYHAPADIQRIECHYWVDADSEKPHSFDKYTSLIQAFSGKEISRESCAIFLHLRPGGRIPSLYTFHSETAWQAVIDLTGFRTLTFMIWRDGDTWHRNPFPLGTPEADDYPSLNEAVNTHWLLLKDYETVRAIWKHSLGPAVLDESIKGHCLKFHPSEYQPR